MLRIFINQLFHEKILIKKIIICLNKERLATIHGALQTFSLGIVWDADPFNKSIIES